MYLQGQNPPKTSTIGVTVFGATDSRHKTSVLRMCFLNEVSFHTLVGVCFSYFCCRLRK